MNARFIISVSWLLILSMVACRQKVNLGQPPTINYGQDVCDECGMIINEQRFAASYVNKAGEVWRFDDIGGMLAYDHKSNEEVHIYWVHDYTTETWIDASQATFVLDRKLVTPMGWGVIAFMDMVGAETYVAANGGVIVSFATLRTQIETGTLDPEAFADVRHEHQTVSE